MPDAAQFIEDAELKEALHAEDEKALLQQQLYQAQKMEAVGRLAGGVAHDFNNILAAMMGYAECLVDDLEPGSEQHGFAEKILKAGDQARSLVEQILTFSRQNTDDKHPLSLADVLEEAVSMLNATVPKSITIEKTITAENCMVEGNANQIAQLVMNLCVNAIDAMEDEGYGTLLMNLFETDVDQDIYAGMKADKINVEKSPPITILEPDPTHTILTLGHVLNDTPYLSLQIRDTGIGMGRVTMERIFEPFFTTKPVEKGTGLGLATVHGTIAAHGYALILSSRTAGSKRGTVFTILCPQYRHADAGNCAQAEAAQATHKAGAGKSHTILLVEDQEDVRDMLRAQLKRMGYTVEVCTNGLDALDVLREKPGAFDVVMSDHNMPGMSGYELSVQAGFDFPDLKFVLISGYNKNKLQHFMDENPAIKDIIRKPVSRKTLANVLDKVLAE